MFTRYFQSVKSNEKDTCFILKSNVCFAFSLLITFCVSSVAGYGQARTYSSNYDSRVDIVPRATLQSLSKERQLLGNRYRLSVVAGNKNLSVRNLVPFYPFVHVNLDTKFLPSTPFRIYLGKLSPGNEANFILVIAPCSENDSLTRYKIQPRFRYLDIGSRLIEKTATRPKWYSVRVTNNNARQDRVTYRQVVMDSAAAYVDNFKTFTKREGLSSRFPTCLVLERSQASKSKDTRIKLQPVILKPSPDAKSTGGARSFTGVKKFFFLDKYTLQDAGGRTNLCCEAPPENGNLIKN